MKYAKWIEWPLLIITIANIVIATLLAKVVSPDVHLGIAATGIIFWLPALWLLYGLGIPFARGSILAGVVLAVAVAIWIFMRLRPEAKYMNLAADVTFAMIVLSWLIAFLIGSIGGWIRVASTKK